jgi:hypothetical protein
MDMETGTLQLGMPITTADDDAQHHLRRLILAGHRGSNGTGRLGRRIICFT